MQGGRVPQGRLERQGAQGSGVSLARREGSAGNQRVLLSFGVCYLGAQPCAGSCARAAQTGASSSAVHQRSTSGHRGLRRLLAGGVGEPGGWRAPTWPSQGENWGNPLPRAC